MGLYLFFDYMIQSHMTIAEHFETILNCRESGRLGTFKRGANGGRFATIQGWTVSVHSKGEEFIATLFDKYGNELGEHSHRYLYVAINGLNLPDLK